jgi:hypothetical protein
VTGQRCLFGSLGATPIVSKACRFNTPWPLRFCLPACLASWLAGCPPAACCPSNYPGARLTQGALGAGDSLQHAAEQHGVIGPNVWSYAAGVHVTEGHAGAGSRGAGGGQLQGGAQVALILQTMQTRKRGK